MVYCGEDSKEKRMLSLLKKAVIGKDHSPNFDRDNLVRDEHIKKLLKEELAAAIKKLQRNHIKSDHIIDRNDEDAIYICNVLEGIFLHAIRDKGTGLRGAPHGSSVEAVQAISFWDIILEITHGDVISEINNLAVCTRVGKSQAWIRLALNDGLMESYLDAIYRNKENLRSFYGANAFLMDTEALPIAIELLQGLTEFQFQLNYNTTKLDKWPLDSLHFAGIIAGKRRKTNESYSRDSREKYLRGRLEEHLRSESLSFSEQSSDRSRASSDAEVAAEAVRKASNSTTSVDSMPSTTSEDKRTAVSTLSSSSYETNNSLVQNSGNRLPLGDDAWSGWSSTFEEPVQTEDFDETPRVENSETTSHVEDVSSQDLPYENPSFHTLLQTYAPVPLHTQTSALFEQGSYESMSTTDRFILQQDSGPISPTEDENIHHMNYEVVPLSSSLKSEHNDEKTQFLLDHITTIGLERGLDKQNFQCVGCGRPIGLIYGHYRVCYYDGGYYCLECHSDEEHVIPAKIIHNWDFQPYKVTKMAKSFLMKIEEEPLFHIDEINPTLYNAVPDLNGVKLLRIQLQHLKGYILTCKNDIAEDFRKRLWPREYLCDDIHQYSTLDLVQVHSGQLVNHLRKVIIHFSKHVYKCLLCSQKGFICEICGNEKIIYPFEVFNTMQCHRCLSVYHRGCMKDKSCTKCLRLQFRRKKHGE